MTRARDMPPADGGGGEVNAVSAGHGLTPVDRVASALLAAVPYPALVLDDGLRVVAINAAARGRVRPRVGEVAGAHVGDLIMPAQWTQLRGLYERALAGEVVREPEVDLFPPGDPQRGKSLRAIHLLPIEDDGAVIGLVCTYTDEPMRLRAERGLRVLTDLHAMLSQAGRAAAQSAGPDELYAELCRIAVEVGHLRCAWVGVPDGAELRPLTAAGDDRGYFDDLFVSVDPADPRSAGPSGMAYRTGEMQVAADFLVASSGQPWYERAERAQLRASAAIPFKSRGRVVATLNVYAEQVGFFTPELVATFGELQSTVTLALDRFAAAAEREQEERQRRHLEEQLRQSTKMEAIGTLAGGVAHDFNNTLTVIRNTCRLLLCEVRDPHQAERIRQIDLAAEGAASLTSQLLTFGRRQVVRPEFVSLDEVVRDTSALARRLLGEATTLRTQLGAPAAHFTIDRGDLQQVILNLAANARDAMPDGGFFTLRTATVEVTGERAATRLGLDPGCYAYLEASDTGVGMDAATLERIFEPFFTTKELGSGLGLATLFGVVTGAGGRVWAYSEPGLGTTLRLYFRVADGEAPSSGPAPVLPTELAGHETLLVVEDSAMLRPIVAEMLAQSGYAVITAVDGVDALTVAAEHEGTIDLVLTDVVMPRMNGGELAQRLTEARPGIKVIFTSGYPEDTVVRHGIAEASVAFVQKPYTADDLLAQVRRVLDGADG